MKNKIRKDFRLLKKRKLAEVTKDEPKQNEDKKQKKDSKKNNLFNYFKKNESPFLIPKE